jgi:hypothetical protein
VSGSLLECLAHCRLLPPVLLLEQVPLLVLELEQFLLLEQVPLLVQVRFD